MAETPMARGLIVCEQIIVDHHSRNISLINRYSGWNVERFPSAPQRFSVFALLTNGSGSCTMKVVISRMIDDEVVYERRMPLYFPSPVVEVPFTLRITQCEFPEAGNYVVQLFAQDELIADTVLRIYSFEGNQ